MKPPRRFPPAVFAAASGPHRKILGQILPPCQAWPDFTDPQTCYTLPTLFSLGLIRMALYQPTGPHTLAAKHQAPQLDSTWLDLLFEERYMDLDRITSSYLPGSPDIYDQLTAWSRDIFQENGSTYDAAWTSISLIHDIIHQLHWQVSTYTQIPAVKIIRSRTLAIFALLKTVIAADYPTFQDEFEALNQQLTDCLAGMGAVEEAAAEFAAFCVLSPEVEAPIVDELRHRVTTGPARLFRTLGLPCGGTSPAWEDWWNAANIATMFALRAEHADPEHPARGAKELWVKLRVENAHHWTDAQWKEWIDESCLKIGLKNITEHQMSEIFIDGLDDYLSSRHLINLDDLDDMHEAQTALDELLHQHPLYPRRFAVALFGSSDGLVGINIISPDFGVESDAEVLEIVFYESMRQQLIQYPWQAWDTGRRSQLCCPFARPEQRACCGFGPQLRALWEHLPPVYRTDWLTQPSDVCMNYRAGSPSS